jgi:hypothetical protein
MPRRSWELYAYNFVLHSDVDIVLNLTSAELIRTAIIAPSTSHLYIPEIDFEVFKH